MTPPSVRHAAVLAALALFFAPASTRAQPADEGRCWVAIRVTGPEAMRVSQAEAELRLRERCRAGDAIVFLTDTGQPFGPAIALYCDMARPFLVERGEDFRDIDHAHADASPRAAMLTCTYRGARRPDR